MFGSHFDRLLIEQPDDVPHDEMLAQGCIDREQVTYTWDLGGFDFLRCRCLINKLKLKFDFYHQIEPCRRKRTPPKRRLLFCLTQRICDLIFSSEQIFAILLNGQTSREAGTQSNGSLCREIAMLPRPDLDLRPITRPLERRSLRAHRLRLRANHSFLVSYHPEDDTHFR